ncbi:MAG TPA: tail fiber domain-containing protein [Pyrinomonadaceae bacterium]
MLVQRLTLFVILSLILFVNTTLAQNGSGAQTQQSSSPAVTASVSAGGSVRFTAPAQVTQIRLEIYNAQGAVVYDSLMRQGSIIDWKVTDATASITDGSYLVVVSVRDFQGKLRQRLGSLSFQSGQLTLQRLSFEDLTAEQSKALTGSRQAKKIEVVDNDAITILTEGKARSATVAVHDGENGQVTATSGALTLRTGDVLTGEDKEQMRITPDGRVGIGTDKPEATLDVAGTIRARGGIRFADGTVLTSAGRIGSFNAQSTTNSTLAVAGTASLSGSGTTGSLTKWSDGAAGVIGDSAVFETGGKVGIGTTSPGQKLQVIGQGGFFNSATDRGVTINPGLSAGVVDVYGDYLGGTEPKLHLSTYSSRLGAGGITINQAGNVGIGTTTPANRLEVAGNLKIVGEGNALIFPDGTSMTTANAGGSLTGNSVITAINDPLTDTKISDARVSLNLARLNAQNAWTGQNTFVNGLSANGVAITNVGNPVSATDAANKAYVDSGFVKFVPGTEQLSVGDANGTAAMINLRGGSTCCSGPGGHTPAWFKVFQNGSFVATGNLGIGVSPMQGKGYRTSWDSYKGAFRSGYADAEWDDANVGFFSWAGGSNSTAIGLYALAFGDTNSAESTSSIVFGSGNQVKGAAGFSAGAGNRVCDTYGVALGNNAKSGGPLINGKCDPDSFNIRGLAAVAIGYNVTADQDHTTAMGKFASNNGFTGTFVWSDGSATASADTFRNTANNEFALRATGGFRFRTNLAGTTGCNLPAGSGVFNCTSSRYTKENFSLVNGNDVLARLRKIQVSTWNYISEGNKVRHIGPMAEDFYAQFGLGTGNTSIGVQDLAAVSLAAVKALDTRTTELQQKTAEVDQLRTEVNELRSANALMMQRLNALEQNAAKNVRQQKAHGRRR